MINARHPSTAASPAEFSTIAVLVGRDLVGDALMKLPFLRALRHAFPQAQIHWITSEGPTAYASVLRQSTAALIDVVHECPDWISRSGRGRTQHAPPQMKAPSFDLLIDTRNRWRLALQARNEIPHAVFLAMALRGWMSDRLPFPRFAFRKRPVHLVDKLLRLVELAAQGPVDPCGALPVPERLRTVLRSLMPEGPVYVGLAPGAGNPAKIWPLPLLESLASSQLGKGRKVVFLLGPEELKIYDALVAAFPSALFPLQDNLVWDCAQLTLEHTLAVSSLLDVAVANDSGVGHMLAAVDCPLISLFGPTSPAKLAPRVSRGRVIVAQAFGSPDMRAIPWQAVDRAVDAMLEESRISKGG